MAPTIRPRPATARELRPYQVEAADAVSAAHARGVQSPAVVMATGLGKSTVIAETVRRAVSEGQRVLLIAHRNELIEQMSDTVVSVNPTGPWPSKIGGPYRDDPDATVVSATVQSLQNSTALDRLGVRDLVICDEAHHAVANTYTTVFDHFPAARRVGFTATMIRHAPGPDEKPLRSVWHEVVFERDIVWAVENGFLLRPNGVTVKLPELDTSTMRTGRDGDFTDDAATEAMMRPATLSATVEAVCSRAGGLSSIVFGTSVEHCEELARLLCEVGTTAEVVTGAVSSKVRGGIYDRFRSGATRVLVTVDVLTEGADFPTCEAVVLARPTRSQSRLVQQVGRALRPHTYADGTVKDTALVLDLVGAGSLGLIVETTLDHRESGEAAVCRCPEDCDGTDCDETCSGVGCDCPCRCGDDGPPDDEPGEAEPEAESVPCTCTCGPRSVVCRCGCVCDVHRIDPLVDFDPVTGTVEPMPKRRRTDSAWSQRTASIRWSAHPRGLVRPVFRSTGSRGTLMLADMRGVAGSTPGRDWALGFFDSSLRRMFWVGVDGGWREPGPDCHLRGFSLDEADSCAANIFPGHMRDVARREPSAAQVDYARSIGVPDADRLDSRDLSDMLALHTAEKWLPRFERAEGGG